MFILRVTRTLRRWALFSLSSSVFLVACSRSSLSVGGNGATGSGGASTGSVPATTSSAASGPNLFFATRQSSTDCGLCALGTGMNPAICNGCSCAGNCAQTLLTANDLFGCGSLGSEADGCGVLDRTSQDGCSALGAPWSCVGDGCDEANVVKKGSSAGGGVLCCRD